MSAVGDQVSAKRVVLKGTDPAHAYMTQEDEELGNVSSDCRRGKPITRVILHPREPGMTGEPFKNYPLYLPSRGHGKGAIIYGPREREIGLRRATNQDPEEPPYVRPYNKVSFEQYDNPDRCEQKAFYVRPLW